MSFQVVKEIFIDNWPMFYRGIKTTLFISIIGTLVGTLIGLLVGIIRTIPKPEKGPKKVFLKIVDVLLAFYIEFFRGTPMMVQATVIYFGTAQAFGVQLDVQSAALFIVSINTGAYMSEIVRGGILSVDKGQFEAAQALGMNHFKTMIYVVLPQVIRNILPATGNEFVVNVKDTSVLNVIGVTELFFQTKSLAGSTYKYFEVYFITCIIYFVLTFIITRILRFIEKKMDGPKNYNIIGNQMQVKQPKFGKGA